MANNPTNTEQPRNDKNTRSIADHPAS